MTKVNDYIDTWHRDEREWWNTHGDYMTFQWRLTPTLHQITRTALEQDYIEYLYAPGGRLLDIGCGSGWLSLLFARKGMVVSGLDISHEQIDAANRLKEEAGLKTVRFECSDFMDWNAEKHVGEFDSVFVNAFLHHLPEQELSHIVEKISRIVKPGGRVFMYEPLACNNRPGPLIRMLDYMCNFGHRLLQWIPRRFDGLTERHRSELARGYTMNSPHERPVDITLLREACGHDFIVSDIRGWHLHSIGFAMSVTSLNPAFRRFYEPLGFLWYGIDRLLLGTFGWQAFSLPGRFILCGVKLTRK